MSRSQSQHTPIMQEQPITLEGQIIEGQTLDKQGHEVRVTVIQGGTSKNGFSYDEQTLQHLAPMLEGAQAYADHDAVTPVRSVRDMVGFYTNASYVAPTGTLSRGQVTANTGRVDATLHILEAASWLWSIIYESVAAGKPNLIGLSVDIFGTWQQSANNSAKNVTGIRQINSCDIVTRPSAGGSFQRILHSEQEGDSSSMDPKDKKNPDDQANKQQEPPALSAPPTPHADTTPPSGASGAAARTLSGGQVITEQQSATSLDTQVNRINPLKTS